MTPEEWIAYAARALEREQRSIPDCPECRPDEPHFADCPVQNPSEQILEALAFLDEVLDE